MLCPMPGLCCYSEYLKNLAWSFGGRVLRSLTVQALQLPRDCIPSWCTEHHGNPVEAVSRWIEA